MGYTYTSVPTFQDEKLRLEAHAGDDYKVLEGKALDDLEGFEVAISKEYAQTLGTNILGGTLEFLDFEFTVESIIEYPNYEMAYQPLETLSQVDLFEEGILGAGITTDTATKALQEDLVRQYFDEYGEDFGLEIPEYHLLKVKFDTFTYDKERELLNSIASVNVWSRTFDNMFEIDSLTILTKSNPPSVNLWSA